MTNDNDLVVALQRSAGNEDLPIPTYMSLHAAGVDLCAAIEDDLVLAPGTRALVPTGFSLALPEGHEAQIRPRSGLALKHGITVLNTPGTIDADYRGEVGVILINLGEASFTIRRGDRIAQMVMTTYARAQFHVVDALSTTHRGAGGFGSTGKSDDEK